MARTYKRDSRGRFASGGGSSGSGGRPKARMQQRGTNRLTRDNAGRIQGIGGSGATARGGRLKTASGKQRGAVLMKAQGQGRLRGGKGGGGASGQKPGTVPLNQVKRYNALDRARHREKQTYSREISRVTGSTDRRRADAAWPKADLASRKTSRIEATMRRLSNSPNSPNVPVLPKAKKVGERITGRRNLYKRVTPTTRAARIASTIRKAAAQAPTKPTTFKQGYDGSTGRRSRSMAGAAKRQSSRRQVVRSLRGLGRYNSTRFSRGTARQGTIFGGTSTTYGRPRSRR